MQDINFEEEKYQSYLFERKEIGDEQNIVFNFDNTPGRFKKSIETSDENLNLAKNDPFVKRDVVPEIIDLDSRSSKLSAYGHEIQVIDLD